MKFLKLLTCALTGAALSTSAFANLEKVSTANQDFGQQLIERVVKEEHKKDANKNVFLSPLSASLALSMLANGAGGSTLNGIVNALSAKGLTVKELNEANKAIVASLSRGSLATAKDASFTLTIANSIWNDSESLFSYAPAYERDMKSVYQAEVKSIAFKKSGAGLVNKWASDKTNGKIPSIIDQETIDSLWFILMNATYFKANWADPFYEVATKKNVDFTLASGAKAKVEMMQQSEKQLYWETEEAQIVELPYAGYRASMLVMLPKPGHSIDSLISGKKSLAAGAVLKDFQRNADTHRVILSLPKFSFEYSVKLNDVLKALGMTMAFDDAADFSLIGSPASKVGLVKQNTFVKIDEKGTEAAAVTLVGGMEATSVPAPVPTVTMNVNRPFYVTIIDRENQLPIFSGVVMNPAAE